MPNEAKLKQMLQDLSAAFPEEAIERTEARATGRGYNTTGVKVMYVIMRLNAVCGLGGWRLHREVTCTEITTQSGRKGWSCVADVVLELVEWVDGTAVAYAEAVADGGHISYSSEADSRKGATSNGLKKAAAMFNCGWQAFAGVIDEDNEPIDPSFATAPPKSAPVQSAPKPPATQPQQTPPGYVRTGPAVDTRPSPPERNRLSSKQLAAIMSISRKLGVEPSALRSRVKTQFGAQVEFISREQASQVIKSLDAQLHADSPSESLAS